MMNITKKESRATDAGGNVRMARNRNVCKKNGNDPNKKVKTTICADIPSEDEDVQTRVTVDRTNYKLYWSENDEITVVGFDESDRFKGLELYNVKEIDETDRKNKPPLKDIPSRKPSNVKSIIPARRCP